MRLSNEIILRRCNQLTPLLERSDIVGYVAARNTKILSDLIVEYVQMRDKLIVKYGDRVLDDKGKETGEIALYAESDNFSEFLDEIRPYAEIEQEVNLVTLKYEQAIGLLSGTELLEFDWMFED